MSTMNRTTPLRRRALLCAAFLLALAAVGAHAEGYPKLSMYVTPGVHTEARELTGTADHFEATAGIAYLVWDWFDLYAGLRAGVFPETVATAYMASELATYYPVMLGAETYFLMPVQLIKGLVTTAGVATDILVYTDAVHWNPDDFQPTYWHVEAFVGLRYYFSTSFHLETRVAAGTLPLFDGLPVFLSARLGLGLDF
jgi:hypothetical protein